MRIYRTAADAHAAKLRELVRRAEQDHPAPGTPEAALKEHVTKLRPKEVAFAVHHACRQMRGLPWRTR